VASEALRNAQDSTQREVRMDKAIAIVEARVKRYDRQLRGSVGVGTSSYNQALAVRDEARAILELLRRHTERG
jgi:hypothetical protein